MQPGSSITDEKQKNESERLIGSGFSNKLKENTMKTKMLRLGMNLWPPFLGAGIKVNHIGADFREVVVSMKLRWYNRNYVGTHFGGSLAAMTDPFYMLMLIHILGSEYTVWDKTSTIDFIAPGRGAVTARFRLNDDQIAEIMDETAEGKAYFPALSVDIVSESGEIVAHVKKKLYVRKNRVK
jgi:acyl-coenzyme A thioesterase PaaI-like protein